MEQDKPIVTITFSKFPPVGAKVKLEFPDRTYEGTVIRVDLTKGTYVVQVDG